MVDGKSPYSLKPALYPFKIGVRHGIIRPVLFENAMHSGDYKYIAHKFLEQGLAAAWLRHYATRRKVACSIPDELIECFSLPNPSSRAMALGFT
jgi:hypothetical protein